MIFPTRGCLFPFFLLSLSLSLSLPLSFFLSFQLESCQRSFRKLRTDASGRALSWTWLVAGESGRVVRSWYLDRCRATCVVRVNGDSTTDRTRETSKLRRDNVIVRHRSFPFLTIDRESREIIGWMKWSELLYFQMVARSSRVKEIWKKFEILSQWNMCRSMKIINNMEKEYLITRLN